MTFNDLYGLAVTNLGRQKLRTVLTVSGVTIGVGALVLMVSLGIGLREALLHEFEVEELLKKVTVLRFQKEEGDIPDEQGKPRFPIQEMFRRRQSPMNEEDATALRAIPGVTSAYAEYNTLVEVSLVGDEASGTTEDPPAVSQAPASPAAVSDPASPTAAGPAKRRPRPVESQTKAVPADELPRTFQPHLMAGRVWTDPEAAETVLPTGIIRALYGVPAGTEPDPARILGTRVRLEPFRVAFTPLRGRGTRPGEGRSTDRGREFTVVGVYRSAPFGPEGLQVLLSAENGRRVFESVTKEGGVTGFFGDIQPGQFPRLTLKVDDPGKVPDVVARVEAAGYDTITIREITQSIRRFFLIVEAVLGAVGGIGLIVSFFGILNTMSMALLERTREIGILKALGARPRDLRRLFLVEAGLIGMMGACLGIVAGWLAGALLDAVAHKVFPDIPPETALFVTSGTLTAGSIAFATVVSMLAGLAPAVRAARLDPTAALRQ